MLRFTPLVWLLPVPAAAVPLIVVAAQATLTPGTLAVPLLAAGIAGLSAFLVTRATLRGRSHERREDTQHRDAVADASVEQARIVATTAGQSLMAQELAASIDRENQRRMEADAYREKWWADRERLSGLEARLAGYEQMRADLEQLGAEHKIDQSMIHDLGERLRACEERWRVREKAEVGAAYEVIKGEMGRRVDADAPPAGGITP